MPAQVWRRNATGELFHNDCFEEGESKDGFTIVKLTELTDDDECESCLGVFLSGLEPNVDTDDEDEDC